MISRRFFLGGTFASIAQAGLAAAPEVSLRPTLRPGTLLNPTIPDGADLVAAAQLGGRVGYAVADALTGEMLEVFHPLHPLPPASTAKAITAAYALEYLGPGYRFRTRLLADGRVERGRLEGDLWLVGSGDPLFDTDMLAGLAGTLRELGLREVTGRLMVATGALPEIFEIDAGQPDHVGYNPAIGALNLNFNRVHFEWTRRGDRYDVTMDARTDTRRPAVQIARMRIESREAPLYTYTQVEGQDHWTVARPALGNGGSRWLPVRRPLAYAVEVFQSLARSNGIVLNEVAYAPQAPEGAIVLAEHVGAPLHDTLRGMLRWSTNLTAEVVGLKASQARGQVPSSLSASATAMTDWMRDRLDARQAVFVDHSGLGDQSRIRPQDMTRALVTAGSDGLLRRLLRDIPMRDEAGNVIESHPVSVVAKTGTLNFVSALAGYARGPGGRDLAFSIFCGDLERRAALTVAERERPDGGASYNRRAKKLQQALIERWAAVYD